MDENTSPWYSLVMDEPNKMEEKRNPDGTFAVGHAGGPGRPKGKTMKEFAREYFMLKSDAEKIAYIENLEEKKPGFAWSMGEGNPATNTDITSGGKPIVSLSPEVVEKNAINTSTESDSEGHTQV